MYPYKIFNLFYLYGLMIAIGLLAAFIVLFYWGKKKKIEDKFVDFIFYNGIASIIVGFGAAALFQATYNYIENPEAGFQLGGGITFMGGLVGGVVCFLGIYFIFRKRFKTKLVDTLSMFPCAILIGHAFGRIGCFFAGCCHGVETDAWYGVQMLTAWGWQKVVPTQLFEAVFLFLMFGICFYLLMKKDFKHNLSLYLVSYGIFRFLIEYVRADHRGEFVTGISPSQFWGIIMIVAGVALYLTLWLLEKRKKGKQTKETNEMNETVETIEEVQKEMEE